MNRPFKLHLDEDLRSFYLSLQIRSTSLSRLSCISQKATNNDVDQRLPEFLALEKTLIEEQDQEFRFTVALFPYK